MTSEQSKLIYIRAYNPKDHNFILSTWLKGLRYGSQLHGIMDQKAYYGVYHKLIEDILADSGTEVGVAALADDPDTILGYVVLRKGRTILDWGFVKSVWRNIGIFKLLVPNTVKITTNVTKVGIAILKKHPEVTFNPFAN